MTGERTVRRAVLCVLALAALATPAFAAQPERSQQAKHRVVGVARDGNSIAWASVRPEGCVDVGIWDLVRGGVYRLDYPVPCERVSTGRGFGGIAVSGDIRSGQIRALWVEWGGGNTREWILYTATTKTRARRLLRIIRRPAEQAAAPIRIGTSGLVYSVDRTVTALDKDARVDFTWTAPRRVTNTTAYAGTVAAFLEGGECVLLESGAEIETYTFPRGAVQEFGLGAAGLMVQLPGPRVEFWQEGSKVREVKLPPGARMVGFANGLLVYTVDGTFRGRKIHSGKDAFLRAAGSRNPLTRFGWGLVYARGRHVVVMAMQRMTGAFIS